MKKQDNKSASQNIMGHGVHVVGGGLTGYAAALALAGAGFPVTIYQQDALTDDTLRTTTINPTAYDMLKQLGVIAALPPDALTPVNQIMVTDDAGREKALDPVMSWGNCNHQPLAWVIGNADLANTMHKIMTTSDHITFRELEITGYKPQHPDYNHAAATLITSDGTLIPAGLIIGADGRNSKLRDAAGIRQVKRNLGQTAIVSKVRITEQHQNIAWQKFLDGGPVALMPLADPHMASLVWSMTNENASWLIDVDDKRFAMALDDATGLAFGRITHIDKRQSFPVIPTHALWPVTDRLVLIGDAAHAINPLAGQGYNLALADIKTLTQLLISAWRDGLDLGSRHILDRYALKRIPEVSSMTLATDGLNMLFSFGKRRRRLAGMGMALANLPGLRSLAEHVASGKLFGR